MTPIRAVVFDAAETLIDESRSWSEWADWLRVPRFTFMAVLGGVIARGEHHNRVFELIDPRFDLEQALAQRSTAGRSFQYRADDLYADVRPTLAELRSRGFALGAAGNFGSEAESFLRALQVFDLIGSSQAWKVEKPSPRFFEHAAMELALDPAEIAYVGDRLDNDVAGAAEAGMFSVFIERGPWAVLRAGGPAPKGPDLTISSLEELPDALAGASRTAPHG